LGQTSFGSGAEWPNGHGNRQARQRSGRTNLAAALNGVFDSQIAGGKRYDLATAGRRAANATFFESHQTDKTTELIFGMDLTPLVADPAMDIAGYTCSLIEKFQADVRGRLSKRLGGV
jgi:hypothetical protein